jgi:DNA (cytosine-5)-methyltransferase 1
MHTKIASIFSFFSGSGFLDLGFDKAGYSIDFVNEIFTPFLYAYKYSRLKMDIDPPQYGYWGTDVYDYLNGREAQLRDFISDTRKDSQLVGFIGGPPCPDFSIGGKNRGQEGERGKLSLTYIELIVSMQPDFFLFENVKGLWQTTRHRQFYNSLKVILHNAGYATTERLTNSFEYGVPQDRDRILLFGVKKTRIPKEHYEENTLLTFPWENDITHPMKLMKDTPWPEHDPFMPDAQKQNPNPDVEPLTVQHWFDLNDVERHPNSTDHFTPRNGITKMRTIAEGDVSKKSYKRLHRWRYSPTAAYGNNEVHLHPYKERRISASEAMAIQSLPAEFELPPEMTLSNKFKTIGNGVPFLLAKGVAQTINDYLGGVVCKG